MTNTGPTTVAGDLGVSPGTSITGLASLTLAGSSHDADSVAGSALADAATAYAGLSGLPARDLTGRDLGSVGPLEPGVYRFSSSAALTGVLTLDYAGHPDEPFVFQIGSTLVTASNASVVVENGGPKSGIYWLVGSSATLGTGTVFAGNILADQSITLDTGASIVCGRAIALNAAVTLDANVVSNDCAGPGAEGTARQDFGSVGFSGAGASAVPEPAAWTLMVLGLVGLGGALRRPRQPWTA